MHSFIAGNFKIHQLIWRNIQNMDVWMQLKTRKLLLTSFLDPAFLDDVLVAHGGFSSSPVLPVLPVWWHWRDGAGGLVAEQLVRLKLSQPSVRLLHLWPPTYLCPLSPDLRSVNLFLTVWVCSVSLSSSLLFPQSLSLSSSRPANPTWLSLSILCLSHLRLTPLNFFTPLFLSLPPSRSLFQCSSLPRSLKLLLLRFSSFTFRHSSGESAWKETEAEKGEKEEKKNRAGQWIVSLAQQTQQAATYCSEP